MASIILRSWCKPRTAPFLPRKFSSIAHEIPQPQVPFIPRKTFDVPDSIPKTYYIGHHDSGFKKMVISLTTVSLIIECRDFRLPFSTHNPKLERALAGCERIVVFTKHGLGGKDTASSERALKELYGENVVFWDKYRSNSTKKLIEKITDKTRRVDSLTGMRTMVVGMPNVGKSSLINGLRTAGTPNRKNKVAKTGDQPGVTRKVGMPIRIVETEKEGGVGEGAYVLDTPGVFEPFINNGETMIKIGMVQGIKKSLIPDETLVDYLLFRLNLIDPKIYERYSKPTNDVNEFLDSAARKVGKLKAGGVPNCQDAASIVLTQWRHGRLGKFVMDDLSKEAIHDYQGRLTDPELSQNQAKKLSKASRARARSGFD